MLSILFDITFCVLILKRIGKEHILISSAHLYRTANLSTVKPVLSDHSKIDKLKILKTNSRLMKVESISAILLTCIKR